MQEYKDVMFTYGRYMVILVPDCLIDGRVMRGYAVYNTETEVREFETPVFYRAMNMAMVFEDSIISIEKHLDGDDSFDEDLISLEPDTSRKPN